MSSLGRSEDKIRLEDLQQYEEDIGGYCSLGGERAESPPVSGGGRGHHSAGGGVEQEKRIRREIANSNERRRMQSINAGFQSLRTLLPHHEGEKLSKAAILQQTAEYIYQLEQEKTRLLSQNCHLKRLLNQHEGEASATKKRKADSGVVFSMCESGDQGSSPEPVGLVAVVPATVTTPPTIITNIDVEAAPVAGPNDLIDVRLQLDRERRLRMMLEEQVRSLESQLYPERIREITHKVQLQYQQREDDDVPPAVITPIRRESQSGGVLTPQQETAAAVANLQVVAASSLQPVAHTETVIATVTASPPPSPPRLPSILEAAIKAEPKVEVERLPSSPNSVADERVSQARVYLASTSRQNLETIVEAIRHLEGDNLFSDSTEERPIVMGTEGTEPQEMPLALTKHSTTPGGGGDKHVLKVKMNQYLQFHPQQGDSSVVQATTTPQHHHSHHQQQRPGVIVVKQHT